MYKFPKGFIWGVATSAFQVEGASNEDGRGESIWDRFAHTPGKIRNGDTADVSCDHYHRYLEDISHMKELGINSYRFSFSWPRIFPQGTGKPNQKGLDFYKRLIDSLLKENIIPNATLFHWDLPQKLQDRGGWASRDIIHYFGEYAKTMFNVFGDTVSMWATFNEPNVIQGGYSQGVFAPGLTDTALSCQVKHNVLLSHGQAVKIFRASGIKNGQIGIVLDIWKHHPARDCEEDRLIALDADEEQHIVYLNALFKGKYTDYLMRKMEKNGTLPLMYDEDMRNICVPIDYIGVNCYSRYVVSADEQTADIDARVAREPEKYTAMKWEIYPEAIYDAVTLIKKQYNDSIPIFISENGGAFDDILEPDLKVHDIRRIKMLEEYLIQLHKAINEGVNVKGYYLWSLMDNFEWAEGFSKRFGLLYVDFESKARIWKDSAFWYKNLIRNNGICI